MPKKTYRTFSLRGLNILAKNSEGKRVEIVFRTGIQIDSTAKFSTSDEEIQKILESQSGLGRDYYIESVEEKVKQPVVEEKKEEVVEEKLTDIKDIKRFHNLVEMKAYMAEIGLEVPADMNYNAAKAVAKKAGYDFQISKS